MPPLAMRRLTTFSALPKSPAGRRLVAWLWVGGLVTLGVHTLATWASSDRDRSRRASQGRAGDRNLERTITVDSAVTDIARAAPGAWWRAGGVGHPPGRKAVAAAFKACDAAAVSSRWAHR